MVLEQTLYPQNVVIEEGGRPNPKVLDQGESFHNSHQRTLKSRLPHRVYKFIDLWVDLDDVDNMMVLDSSSPIEAESVRSRHQTIVSNATYYDQDRGLGTVINLKRLNDIRYMNKFLESANEALRPGGYFIGSVETSLERWHRLMNKYVWPINWLIYTLDFMVKRVWPKLPYFKNLYFALTNGRNRVISEMETYGRLHSCGFRPVDFIESEGKLYFIAEKVDKPDFNMDPTYGPFIRLRRVGKNGKVIKVRKLRTMYPYSEYLQAHVYKRQGLQKGGKLMNDPRVSTAGRFCRKYWIDELPMFFNLVRGELKIFGVRPLSPHYLSLYPKDFQEYRNKFKPGLIPPFYADLPETLEEIVASEERYLKAYERLGLLADIQYTYKAFYNIFVKKARSK